MERDTLLLRLAGLIRLVVEKETDGFHLPRQANHRPTQSMVRDTLLLRLADLIRQLGENQPHGFHPHLQANHQARITIPTHTAQAVDFPLKRTDTRRKDRFIRPIMVLLIGIHRHHMKNHFVRIRISIMEHVPIFLRRRAICVLPLDTLPHLRANRITLVLRMNQKETDEVRHQALFLRLIGTDCKMDFVQIDIPLRPFRNLCNLTIIRLRAVLVFVLRTLEDDIILTGALGGILNTKRAIRVVQVMVTAKPIFLVKQIHPAVRMDWEPALEVFLLVVTARKGKAGGTTMVTQEVHQDPLLAVEGVPIFVLEQAERDILAEQEIIARVLLITVIRALVRILGDQVIQARSIMVLADLFTQAEEGTTVLVALVEAAWVVLIIMVEAATTSQSTPAKGIHTPQAQGLTAVQVSQEFTTGQVEVMTDRDNPTKGTDDPQVQEATTDQADRELMACQVEKVTANQAFPELMEVSMKGVVPTAEDGPMITMGKELMVGQLEEATAVIMELRKV